MTKTICILAVFIIWFVVEWNRLDYLNSFWVASCDCHDNGDADSLRNKHKFLHDRNYIKGKSDDGCWSTAACLL
jgi:hypothetical protein